MKKETLATRSQITRTSVIRVVSNHCAAHSSCHIIKSVLALNKSSFQSAFVGQHRLTSLLARDTPLCSVTKFGRFFQRGEPNVLQNSVVSKQIIFLFCPSRHRVVRLYPTAATGSLSIETRSKCLRPEELQPHFESVITVVVRLAVSWHRGSAGCSGLQLACLFYE